MDNPENPSPPQEVPAQSITSVTQPVSDGGDGKKKFPVKFLLLGVIAVVLIAASAGATYMVMSKNQNTARPEPSQNAVISPTQPAATDAPKESSMSTFTNEDIEGMTFQYDPQVWEVTQITPENVDEVPEGFNKVFSQSGILMKEKKSDGMLYMKYGYQVGRGGGAGPIYKDHMVKLSGVTRIKDSDSDYYLYGLHNEDTLDIFSDEPNSIDFYQETCDPNYEGFTGFDTKLCPDIESGEIIGFFADPTFTWSLKLKRTGEVADIWPGEDYLGDTQPEMVQIEAQYIGQSPENADKIITQLFK